VANNSTLLTRRQVGALLNASEAEIKDRHGSTLHPIKGPDGSWRYQPEEIAALLRGLAGGEPGAEANGAVCAAGFALFRDGKSLTDVVIELKQTPTVVRGLRVEYDAMAACLTLGPGSLDRLASLLRTKPENEAHLVEIITVLAAQIEQEYKRGHEAGFADASDLGEIVDPSTGQKRPLEKDDIAAAARKVEERWQSSEK
jgi:hypothetical protein